jgi:uncharacterized protein YndB with AHSA1/START domain
MTDSNQNEFVITRVFDAPRELVWKMWTEPEMVMKWWGPEIFTSPTCKIDLRVGGKYLYCMRGPDGKDYWNTGTYQEIVPMEKIVTMDSFSDEHGNIISAEEYGLKGFPLKLKVTVLFEDADGKTKMTLIHETSPDIPAEMAKNMDMGWNQSLAKMEKALAELQ